MELEDGGAGAGSGSGFFVDGSLGDLLPNPVAASAPLLKLVKLLHKQRIEADQTFITVMILLKSFKIMNFNT